MKYYSEETIHGSIPAGSVYHYLYESNKNYLNNTALNYFGRRITFQNLFKSINAAMDVYRNLGLKTGDIVAVITVSIPEFVYSFYALNRLGVIQNMIDPRTSMEGIKTYLKETKCRYLLILDKLYEEIAATIQEAGIEKVILLSPSNSLPLPLKVLSSITNRRKQSIKIDNVVYFKTLQADNVQNDYLYDKSKKFDCCVIVHTGGTTGFPKSVMLSNYNINALVWQSIHTNTGMKRRETWLDIMPPFIAYGIGMGLHLPLVVGMETILIPQFNPFRFDELIAKYKPNHMVGVPSYWHTIVNSKKLKKADLSFMKAPTVGGDTMNRDLEVRANQFLKKHNCEWQIIKGYGMTEVCAGVAGTGKGIDKVSSVGIPLVHMIISVFDPDTGEELGYNQQGEICITGPNVMLGYYNNQTETDKVCIKHKDGNIWVHSGDVGYIDEDGYIFILGRLKRMIIRYDGFKVFPVQIENAILKNDMVDKCVVVGINDSNHSQGKLPVACIIPRTGIRKEKLEIQLKESCISELPEYEQPLKYIFLKELPMTNIGKVDYRELENIVQTS